VLSARIAANAVIFSQRRRKPRTRQHEEKLHGRLLSGPRTGIHGQGALIVGRGVVTNMNGSLAPSMEQP